MNQRAFSTLHHSGIRRSFVLSLFLALAFIASPIHAQDPKKETPGSESDIAEVEAYYVRFSPGRAIDAEAMVTELGGRVTHRLERIRTVAVTLPAGAQDALGRRAGIELIEPVPQYSLQAQVVPYNIDQYQARDIWDRNRDNVVDAGAPDGSGVKFCIIDTGFHGPHDDFAGAAITGFSQISGEDWFEDGNGHGTHVAGTANAVMNNIGVVGAMPGGAELHIVKSFNNSGLWVPGQSNLAAAIQECADRDANVISMSLGGGGPSATEEALFQALYDTGVPGDDGIAAALLSVAAAGNDGNASASYPASYDSVISVAAIDEAEVVANFSQYPATAYDPNNPPANVEWDVVELSGGGVNVLSTYPSPDGSVPAYQAIGSQTFSGSHIDEAGFGDETGTLVDGGFCEAGTGDGSWNGAVVICQRGNVSFAEKVNEVQANGGVAAIIYNNVAGGLAATCGGNCNVPSIPSIGLSQADGLALIADDLGGPVRVVADDGSSCTTCNGGYAFLSGTSMATPGVAAALALAWDACGGPATVTNKDIRQLLRDSAKDLTGTHSGGGGAYGAGWDPATGWGLIQLADARDLGNTRFGGACPIGLQIVPAEADVCTADGSTDLTLTLDDQFLGSATLSASGIPAGTSGSFSPNPVVHPNKDSTYTLSNLGAAAGGSYTIDFTATDDGDPGNSSIGQAVLNLFSAAPVAANLNGPPDGSTGVEARPTLSWTSVGDAIDYELQISTSPTFATTVYTATITGTSHEVTADLAGGTTHFWRVRARNVCGDGGWSTDFSFVTANLSCAIVASSDIPLNLTDAAGTFQNPQPRSTSSTLLASGTDPIDSVRVVDLRGTHTWIADLEFDLTSPGGTTVRLMDSSCGNSDDFWLTLDDAAAGSAGGWPCPPTDQGSYRPSNSLSAFMSEAPNGAWTLDVIDTFPQDTGTLDGWSLEICTLGAAGPAPTTTTIDSIAPAGNQTVGQAYTVDVTVSGATPTGSINVTDGSDLCTISLPGTSCALTSTSVGPRTITASYSGDVDDAPSSDSVAYTIVPAASSTSVVSIAPAASQAYNTPYTVEIGVTGFAPTGTVAIGDGNGGNCDIVLPDTSCGLVSTVVGPITVSAVYSGDVNNSSSNDAVSYQITAIPAGISFSNLVQTYTGSPLGATITTSPPGLATSVTYDGGGEPTESGSYTVVATITEPGYTGSNSDTFTIAPAEAEITLSNLTQTFDGNPKPITATTVPAGLTVDVTYDGTSAAPADVGTYAVAATVDDPNYTGSENGTLEITAANATIAFADLTRTYTGSPLGATITTSPPGLATSVTYDGGGEPTESGSYTVVATITEPGYTGSNSDTFTIAPAEAEITLSNLTQTFDGNPKPITATTVPAGLTVDVTYDGASAAPTDVGSYAVVATVDDPNYTGSENGTLEITAANATIAFADLTRTYTGSPLGATITTSPPGLATSVTYDGGGEPTESGSYTVVATITEPGYTGSNSDTFTIAPAEAEITLSNLTQTFDGNPKPVTAATVPAGLTVDVTYDGASAAPTDVGSYTVVATVDDPNYTGSESGTLEITSANVAITIDSISPANRQIVGDAYAVRVSVTGASPTGTVNVDDGNGASCEILLPAASCDLTSGVIGETTVSASYAGDANHAPASVTAPYLIVAGPADSLVFAAQPSNVLVAESITPSVEVRLLDAFGNPVVDGTVVSISIASNPGGATLAGNASAITTNGTATFPGLSLDAAGVGYTLLASSGNLDIISAPFNVLAPAVLGLSSSVIDFGAIEVGGVSAVGLVSIANGGDVSLNVNAVDAAAVPFSDASGQTTCPAVPFELDADASCQLAYSFSPTSRGSGVARHPCLQHCG
jgi:subtilisin family serine protease/subtilisin-like proprotein convertase family protein